MIERAEALARDMKAITNPAVARVFAAYPPPMRRRLFELRDLILETAAATRGVGSLEETLKWGEPAYLTSASGSGSTIRIAWKKARPDQYAMYFNCQTMLVETFRARFSAELEFEGNRAIVFQGDRPIARDAVASCVLAALTYRRDARSRRRRA